MKSPRTGSTARPPRPVYATVDDYIADQAEAVRSRLSAVRAVVRKAAPQAVERIGYGIPAYKLAGKPLIYFAAFKNHVGVFATPAGHAALDAELSPYKRGKGSVQFPHDQRLPLGLIRRLVAVRIAQIAASPVRKPARKAAGQPG